MVREAEKTIYNTYALKSEWYEFFEISTHIVVISRKTVN